MINYTPSFFLMFGFSRQVYFFGSKFQVKPPLNLEGGEVDVKNGCNVFSHLGGYLNGTTEVLFA